MLVILGILLGLVVAAFIDYTSCSSCDTTCCKEEKIATAKKAVRKSVAKKAPSKKEAPAKKAAPRKRAAKK